MSNPKPKILYIITQAQWGGAQRYVFDLALYLTSEFDVTVAIGQSQAAEELRIKNKELRIIEFKNLVREISPLQDLLAVWEIAQFFKKEKFDLVHLNSSKAGFIGALANSLAGHPAKVIYTAHGWVYLEPLPWLTKKIYLWLEKISAQLRDATIVLSETEKQVALKYGTAKKNSLAVVPQGLNFSQLQFLPQPEARQRLGLAEEKLVVGTIANNYPTKGLKYLDEAAGLLKIKIAVIGENFGANLSNLIFMGFKSDAHQYLKALDIFVLPSVKEGFPYVLLEALAAGLPIIATRVGAMPEIIEDGQSGLVVPPADPPALAQTISKLISNENLRQQLGANALARSKNFTLQSSITQTKSIYHSILKIR